MPYFVFGVREPFSRCVEELDKAFDWAEPLPHRGPDDGYVVIHDGFGLMAWKDFMREGGRYVNVVLDTHQSLMMAESMGCSQTLEGYLSYIQGYYGKEIEEMQNYFDVI